MLVNKVPEFPHGVSAVVLGIMQDGGLPHLGPEVMNVSQLPVYGPLGVMAVLQETRLWRPLLANLELIPLLANEPVTLAAGLTVTPIVVPHRDEWHAGTFAYRIQGPEKSLLYLPDIDAWEMWPEARAVLSSVDVALVDATFFSAEELGGRPPVAHPPVRESLSFYASLPGRVVLTHLNHTNPLLNEEGESREMVRAAGVEVARAGLIVSL